MEAASAGIQMNEGILKVLVIQEDSLGAQRSPNNRCRQDSAQHSTVKKILS